MIRDENKGKSGYLKVVSSRNKIIEYAIEKNYDYILMMDSDVIPPLDIIEELLGCKKPVVSGLYYNIFNVHGIIKMLPIAWMEITEEEFNEMKKLYKIDEKVKSHKDLRRHITEEEAETNKLLEVKFPSAGCMLIKREVFLNARYGMLNKENTGEDIYFFENVISLGFKMHVYTKIKCKHLSLEKYQKKDGKLIHPGFGE